MDPNDNADNGPSEIDLPEKRPVELAEDEEARVAPRESKKQRDAQKAAAMTERKGRLAAKKEDAVKQRNRLRVREEKTRAANEKKADSPVRVAAKLNSDSLCERISPAEEAKEVQEKIRKAAEKMKQAEEEIRRAEQRAKYLAEQEIKEAERKAKEARRKAKEAERKAGEAERLARAREEMKAANERREYYAQFANKRTHLIDAAVEDSILGRAFEDVELRVHSRRTKPGAVHTTLPVYTRTAFLEAASPVLNELLQRNPLKVANGRVLPPNPGDFLDEDSDLEDDDEVVIRDKSPDPTVVNDDIASSVDDDIDDAMFDEMLEDIRVADTSTGTKSETTAAIPTVTSTRLRVIHVEYGAAKTWQALIYYLYTGRVSFRNKDSHAAARLSCSPRSMYILATKLSLGDLRKLSEEAIISDLSGANIVKELFSDFTWRHPEILAREVEIFRGHAQHPEVRAELQIALKNVANGKCPRQGEVVLTALFDTLMTVPPTRDLVAFVSSLHVRIFA